MPTRLPRRQDPVTERHPLASMSEVNHDPFSLEEIVPTAMPILSRGNHKNLQGLSRASLSWNTRRCWPASPSRTGRAAWTRNSPPSCARPMTGWPTATVPSSLPLLGRAIGLAIEPPAGSGAAPPPTGDAAASGLTIENRPHACAGRCRAGSRPPRMTVSPTVQVWSGVGGSRTGHSGDERADHAHHVGGLRTTARGAPAAPAPVLRGGPDDPAHTVPAGAAPPVATEPSPGAASALDAAIAW